MVLVEQVGTSGQCGTGVTGWDSIVLECCGVKIFLGLIKMC